MPIDIPKKVREFAGMAEALAALVEIADKANAWQQQEAEHAGRIAKLQAEEEAIIANIAKAHAVREQVSREATELDLKAREGAQRHAAEAMRKAEAMIADAEAKVEAAKVRERRAEADQRKAEAACATCVARLAELEPKVAEAQAVIAKADRIKKAAE